MLVVKSYQDGWCRGIRCRDYKVHVTLCFTCALLNWQTNGDARQFVRFSKSSSNLRVAFLVFANLFLAGQLVQ